MCRATPHLHTIHTPVPAVPAPPQGFILARKLTILWVPLGLGCSVALTTSGFVLQVWEVWGKSMGCHGNCLMLPRTQSSPIHLHTQTRDLKQEAPSLLSVCVPPPLAPNHPLPSHTDTGPQGRQHHHCLHTCGGG